MVGHLWGLLCTPDPGQGLPTVWSLVCQRRVFCTPVELGFVGSWGRGFRAWEPQQEVLGSPGLPDGPELRLVALPAGSCPPHTPPRCGRGDAVRRALPCPALPAAQMCPELRENCAQFA